MTWQELINKLMEIPSNKRDKLAVFSTDTWDNVDPILNLDKFDDFDLVDDDLQENEMVRDLELDKGDYYLTT